MIKQSNLIIIVRGERRINMTESHYKNIKIWQTLTKIPGGTMFIPLVIGSLITTICQGIFHFNLWNKLGNPMKDMFSSSGQMLLLGIMLFCTGTQLKVSEFKSALKSGILLIIIRLIIVYLLCFIFYLLFGIEGILGISFLTFTCAVTSTNATLYMGIIAPFGNNTDKASFGFMLICTMPMLPLLFLSCFSNGGLTYDNLIQVISLLIPYLLGALLGNIDFDIKNIFALGNTIVMPFLGFQFGSSINLIEAFANFNQGIILSVIFLFVTIIPSFLIERFIMHRPGYFSVASGSLAGVSLSIPLLVDQTIFGTYTSSTMAILAFVLASTNILCPFLTHWNNVYYVKKYPKEALKHCPELLKE